MSRGLPLLLLGRSVTRLSYGERQRETERAQAGRDRQAETDGRTETDRGLPPFFPSPLAPFQFINQPIC